MVTLKNPPSLVPDVINSMPNNDNRNLQNPIKYIVDADMSPDKTNIIDIGKREK
ncbi:16323_t:CDS:2, partial [Gigaspora margarita]